MKIKIKIKRKEVEAELNDTETSRKIYESLPIKGKANLWGEEIYFKIPIEAKLEELAKQDMEVGDLGYWGEGKAFCIFFGKTPVSINEEPRAISPVNFLGKVEDVEIFKKVKEGESIVLKKAK